MTTIYFKFSIIQILDTSGFVVYFIEFKIIDDNFIQLVDLPADEDILEPLCDAHKIPTAVHCNADDDDSG